jgi:cardiolipin synthase
MDTWNIWGIFVSHLGDILSVGLVLAILSGKKEARATLGWVMLVLFLPYLGALLYLVFGRVPFPFPERTPPGPPTCPLPPAGLPPAMDRTAKLVAQSPVPCRTLELLPGAAHKYRALERDLAGARQRIVLCYYVFRHDRTGRRFLELLARKAAEGVEVRLLYDGWGAFGLGLPGVLRPHLRSGLQARPFHPVSDPMQMSRINFRNHRKVVVIDGEIAYTGSINIGDEYLGRHPRFGIWKDAHTRLEGAAAQALEAVFRADWMLAGGDAFEPSPVSADPGQEWVQVISSGPNEGEDNVLPLLYAQFAAAKERIDILTPYLMPDYGLVAALRIAARQGVAVRILVPGKSNHPLVAAAGRSYYDELLEGGVQMFELRDGMLHAKGVLIDGRWAMVGSTNLDNRSFRLNFEINLATSSASFCTDLGRLYEVWLRGARPITLKALAARPLGRRLIEGACRTLSPVL